MGACPFCDLLAGPNRGDGRVIFEDDIVWAAHELDAEGDSYRGAVMLLLKRHTDDGLAGITEEEGERIGRLVAGVSRALKAVVGAAWTYTYCFTEGVRHVHQFVVARYPGVPPRYVRLEIQNWPGAPRGSPEEIRLLAEQLRRSMSGRRA
jgi:diadenosine tetraphosphate (Ap4A) HIT family hydrolase